MSEQSITFVAGTPTSPEGQRLIGALNAELLGQYPEPGATHFRLDPDEVAGERGVFLVAWRGGEPVGCGAVRRIETTVGELKRMYVAPEARGIGLGGRLLRALEHEARTLGLTRVVLETGVRQIAALALYRRDGYAPIAPFGEYVDSPLSVCLGKDI